MVRRYPLPPRWESTRIIIQSFYLVSQHFDVAASLLPGPFHDLSFAPVVVVCEIVDLAKKKILADTKVCKENRLWIERDNELATTFRTLCVHRHLHFRRNCFHVLLYFHSGKGGELCNEFCIRVIDISDPDNTPCKKRRQGPCLILRKKGSHDLLVAAVRQSKKNLPAYS